MGEDCEFVNRSRNSLGISEATTHRKSHTVRAHEVLHQAYSTAHGQRSPLLPTIKSLWFCHSRAISFRYVYNTYCSCSHCSFQFRTLFLLLLFSPLTYLFSLYPLQGPSEHATLANFKPRIHCTIPFLRVSVLFILNSASVLWEQNIRTEDPLTHILCTQIDYYCLRCALHMFGCC